MVVFVEDKAKTSPICAFYLLIVFYAKETLILCNVFLSKLYISVVQIVKIFFKVIMQTAMSCLTSPLPLQIPASQQQ
jgi:hypothetical protein